MRQCRIGTSGFSYKHWRGVFYPEKLAEREWLQHYSTQLDSVEINASFYNLLRPATVERWASTVPVGFRFAVKGSRFITHMKRLLEPEDSTKRFFDSLEPFGRKLGPILWQLPPHWEKDVERLDAFLKALPKTHRYTVELRDRSWLDAEVYKVLCKRKAAFCIFELAGFLTEPVITADWVYVRLHGPGKRKYEGQYGSEGLELWADRIRAWRAEGLDVYCYFDNDQKGYAPDDALKLKEMLGGEEQRAA